MKLSEHQLGVEWLRQFDAREVHVARLLLDTLKLVSFADFERSIMQVVEGICAQTEGYVAVFSVDEKAIDADSKPGSAGRVAHILTSIQRINSARILVQPTDAEMRSKRVNHVVLVEDFVASGGRVRDFWNAWASKHLKSWLSYEVCKLWVAGYAIHDSGMETILERITYLKPERLCFEVSLKINARYWPSAVDDLCEKNAVRTGLGYYPHGFGHIAAPIVFQHGCPDNSPAILWKNGKGFRALFPERVIPPQLHVCFDGSNDGGRGPELLWESGQHKLALGLIDEMSSKRRSPEYIELLTILGLLLRGMVVANLSTNLTATASRIDELLAKAHELGLVDASNSITLFGRDIVERSRKSYLAEAPEIEANADRGLNYVPKQFKKQICGVP